jgi:hypothetical protein
LPEKEGPDPQGFRPFLSGGSEAYSACIKTAKFGSSKPSNRIEYVNSTSSRVPSRITGCQFGFGQPIAAAVELTDLAPTRSVPFLPGVSSASSLSEKVPSWDSMGLLGLFQGLLQSMIDV